jgi:hypothetical protein
VNFTVDDTANQVFGPGELEWKGAMKIDETTRIITPDSAWGGPFPKLYDDGPWTTGGREPKGSVAGDHKMGVTVFVAPPATGSATYEYGLQDATTQGWLWRGANGTFVVASGATAEVTAAGLTLIPFGTTDLKVVIDTNALLARTLADGGVGTWDTSKVRIKGSGWSWALAELLDDGTKGDATAADGKFTFEMSQYVGTGHQFPHYGLGASGDQLQFVFVFGLGDGVEYRDATAPSIVGVTASIKPSGGSYTTATIAQCGGDKNPCVTIP